MIRNTNSCRGKPCFCPTSGQRQALPLQGGMVNQPMLSQAALREKKRAERAALPEERREAMSKSACMRVLALSGYLDAKIVMAYAAANSETDPVHIVEHALVNGKRVCFPVVTGETMLAAEPLSDRAWKRGAFGILEPDMEKSRLVNAAEIGCVIVPGVVFDEYCSRIGQGKGYYDRFLANTRAYRIGFAFECQVVESIDAQLHDIRMDAVATETRLIMSGRSI